MLIFVKWMAHELLPAFWLIWAVFVALGSQRALEYGEGVARAFLDKPHNYGMVHADSLIYGSDADEQLYAFAEELAGCCIWTAR